MIIVSQDRKRIVENLNLGIRNKGEYNQNYVIYNTEIGEDLGEYATEERAKEVLKEIKEAYIMMKMLNTKKFQPDKIIHGDELISYIAYEMPEE